MRDDVTLYRRLSLAGRIHKMTSARLHLPIQGVGPPPKSSLMRNSLTPALVTLIRVPPMTSHSVRAAAADTPLLESCGWMHFLPNCSGQLSGQTGFAGIDTIILKSTLQWRRNDHDGVSNHQPHGCLLNRLFRRRSKKTSRLRVTGLWGGGGGGGFTVTGHRWIPRKRASDAENVSIWWRHHEGCHQGPFY